MAIDGRPDDDTGPLLDVVLKPLYAAYAAMKRAREARGPLDLDLPERKIILDKADGTVDRVVVPERLESHRLIEEFMIPANVAAAETLEKHKTALLYRVHDKPSAKSSRHCANSSRRWTLAAKWRNPRRAVQPRAGQGKGQDDDAQVSEMVLRSQAQADYSADNYGHFGLNLDRYAHFTSPIRRYADLIVHRALITARTLRRGRAPRRPGSRGAGRMASTISGTERRAMLAERETSDRLLAQFLATKIGAEFMAASRASPRVRPLRAAAHTGADGFIPASTIGQRLLSLRRKRCRRWSAIEPARRSGSATRSPRLVEAAPWPARCASSCCPKAAVTGAHTRPSQRRSAKSRPERGPKKHYGQRRK